MISRDGKGCCWYRTMNAYGPKITSWTPEGLCPCEDRTTAGTFWETMVTGSSSGRLKMIKNLIFKNRVMQNCSSYSHLNCLTHTFDTLCTRHLQNKRKAYFTCGFVHEDRWGPSDNLSSSSHIWLWLGCLFLGSDFLSFWEESPDDT